MKRIAYVYVNLLWTIIFFPRIICTVKPIEGYGILPLTKKIGTTVDDIESQNKVLDSKCETLNIVLDNLETVIQIASQYPIVIKQTDLPLTITEPGNYVTCDNLIFNPTANNEIAITIASNFVTIDFNGKSLSQGNTIASTSAIKINSQFHDITIKNGSIAEFTGSTSANAAYIYAENKNHHVTLDSINFFGHSTSSANGNGKAIWMNTTYDSTIQNCHIAGFIPSSSSSYDDIILISNANNIAVQETSVNNNISLSGPQIFNSTHILSSSNCIISDCSFNNNTIFSFLDSHILSIEGSSGVQIKNCTSKGNNNNSGNLNLIYLTTTNGCTMQNCTITDNQVSASGHNLYAIYEKNSHGSIIQNCMINNNLADTTAIGMYVSNSNGNQILKCKINSMAATTGNGIQLEDCTSSIISECTSAYNSNSGLNINAGCINPVINNNYIYNNSVYGIYNDSESTVITNCITNGNGINFASASDVQAKTAVPRNNTEYGYSGPGSDAFDKKDGIIYVPAYAIENTGLTITKPGHYMITEPVNFDGASASTAITIAADYVTLDLNNYALANINTNTNVNAIAINEGTHNIAIKNGVIAGFTGNSTRINQNCSNITLNNLSFVGLAPSVASRSAISIIGTSETNNVYNIQIEKCDLSFFYVDDETAVLQMEYTDNANIVDCTLNNNGSTTITALQKVIKLISCNNCTFSGCELSKNICSSFEGRIIQINSSKSITVEQTIFNNNILTENSLVFLVKNCNGTVINNCIMTNNQFSATIPALAGCIFIQDSTTTEIASCLIKSHSTTHNISNLHGIYVSADSTSTCIHESQIIELTAATLGNVCGILLDFDSHKNYVDNVTIINVSNSTNPNNAYGILVGNTTYPTIVRNCSVSECYGFGIYNDSDSILTGAFWGNESVLNAVNFDGRDRDIISTTLSLQGDSVEVIPKYENTKT